MPANIQMISSPERARLPAWAFSLGLHLVLGILAVLCLQRSVTNQPAPAPREVGIVLAQSTAPNAERYFRDATEESSPAMRQAANPAAASGSSLPSASAPPKMPLPELQLPGAALNIGSADDLLVPSLDLGGRPRQPIFPGSGDEEILAEEAAWRAARQACGPPTEVSLFGSARAAGRTFVFAIDRSKSMGGDGLNALQAASVELGRSLSHLTDQHKFQLVAYHHKCLYLTGPKLLPATAENKAKVGPFIKDLPAYGGTGHDTALRVALAMEPDAIFLLTDGGDPYLTQIQLANLRRLARDRTSIHCIQFGFGPNTDNTSFMQRLASENGGGYTYVDMSARRTP